MTALNINAPYPYFTDVDGLPLENGAIYIGDANLDPRANPAIVYWDEALTIPASQPLRTSGGYVVYQGTPAKFYVNAVDYSIYVETRRGEFVLQALTNGAAISAGSVFFSPGGTGAGSSTVEQALKHHIHPDQFTGFDNNGTTADRVPVQNAINRASTLNEELRLYGVTAYVEAIPTSEFNWNVGPQPSLILPDGFKGIDGNGATINLSAARGICGGSLWSAYATYVAGTSVYDPALFGTISTNLAVGDVDIPLSLGDGAKFAIGDTVFAKLGELAYDLPEPQEWYFAKVVNVSGDTITLDRPVTRPFVLADATTYGKYIVNLPLYDGLTIRDIKLAGPVGGTAENGLDIRGVVNSTYSNIRGERTGAGVVIAQMVQNLTIENLHCESPGVAQASHGRALTIAQGRDVTVTNISARNARTLAFCEAESTVKIDGALFENTLLSGGSPRTDIKVFVVGGRSTVDVNNLTVVGYGGFEMSADTPQTGTTYSSSIRFGGTTKLQLTTDIKQLPVRSIRGILDATIAGTRTRYDFDNQIEWKRRFDLRNGMYLDNILGPTGIITDARIYLSPGLVGRFGTGLELTGMFIGRVGNNGQNALNSTNVFAGPPVAGSVVGLALFGGTDGGASWTLRDQQIKLLVSTAAGTGLDADTEFVELTFKIAPPMRASEGSSKTYEAWTEAEWRAQDDKGANLREAQFTAYDLPSIAAGATLQVDFAIAAIAAGDYINSVSIGSGLTGLSIRSAEAIAGNCRVIFENQTGAPIDKGATNIIIQWSKPQIGA